MPSLTLDQPVANHYLDRIDLLKVDCEGGEYELFRHASDDALARVDRVTLEWHMVGPETDELLYELRQRLDAAGFKLRANDWAAGSQRRSLTYCPTSEQGWTT